VNKPKQFVEVTIAGRTLKLSPVPPEQLRPIRETCDRWVAAKGKPMDEAFFKMRAIPSLLFSFAQNRRIPI
jgi:hypothetical protein